jgi:death-on-curing protein
VRVALVYFTIEQAIEIHDRTLEMSGGGLRGYGDLGVLEGVLDNIRNDDYYPTFVDKITHLFFCVCKFHSFADANKRLAIALSAHMLLCNGYLYCVDRFIREMENISYHVARDMIDKGLLNEIINALLFNEEDDEELKLKILRAISSDHEKPITDRP